MRDMTSAVKDALEAQELTVYYAYPQEWTTVPVIAYFESANTEYQHADDAELTSLIEYTVDIWAVTPEQTHTLGDRANAAMQSLGFSRVGCYDLYETDTSLHHRSMTYQLTEVSKEE